MRGWLVKLRASGAPYPPSVGDDKYEAALLLSHVVKTLIVFRSFILLFSSSSGSLFSVDGTFSPTGLE